MNEQLRITPFADLREGDEFVRVGGRPVKVSDLTGTISANGKTLVARFPALKGGFPVRMDLRICVMVKVTTEDGETFLREMEK